LFVAVQPMPLTVEEARQELRRGGRWWMERRARQVTRFPVPWVVQV
jgi:hypothetical protein